MEKEKKNWLKINIKKLTKNQEIMQDKDFR